jgi:peptidoglycan/xylan/chitin deacetylase (PgdA/CDA1 family)
LSATDGRVDSPFRSLRSHASTIVQAALYWSGLGHLYARRRDASQLTILMYHSVSDGAAAEWIAPRNRMEPRLFERQMRFLARRRRVVSLDELVDRLERGLSIGPKAVALTFDDGYRDNLEVAAPILHRYGLPAVLYLATGYVTRGENQWADRLYAAVRHRRMGRVELHGQTAVDLHDPKSRAEWYRRTHGQLLAAQPEERTRVLGEIEARLEAPTAERQTLVWDEVRELARRFPDFLLGVHGSEHLDLTSLPEDQAIDDIERSIRELEGALGCRPRHFSFPYNRSTPALRARLAGLGFRSSVGGEGFMQRWPVGSFDLVRKGAPRSGTQLRLWTSGVYRGLSVSLVGLG